MTPENFFCFYNIDKPNVPRKKIRVNCLDTIKIFCLGASLVLNIKCVQSP